MVMEGPSNCNHSEGIAHLSYDDGGTTLKDDNDGWTVIIIKMEGLLVSAAI